MKNWRKNSCYTINPPKFRFPFLNPNPAFAEQLAITNGTDLNWQQKTNFPNGNKLFFRQLYHISNYCAK